MLLNSFREKNWKKVLTATLSFAAKKQNKQNQFLNLIAIFSRLKKIDCCLNKLLNN